MNSYEEKLLILGKKIRKKRNELGLTVKELASMANIPASSFITFIETAQKQKPNVIYLKRLLQTLKMDYLFEFKELGFIDDSPSSKPHAEFSPEILYIPIYNSILDGYNSNESNIIDFIPLPKSINCDNDIFGFRMNDDSMEPILEKESIVLIKKKSEITNQKVGAFILNNETFLRKYLFVDKDVILRSENDSIYTDINIKQSDKLIIIGQFVGMLNLNG